MEQNKSGRKGTVFLIAMLSMVYFSSYLTRKNYQTVIQAIIECEGTEEAAAGLVSTALFITYGIGQLISGYLGDKINPKWLIAFGILLSSSMNILLPGAGSVNGMIAIWAVNGFAQAMFWPPIIRIMAKHLSGDDYSRASVWVSVMANFAEVLLYLVCPLIISLSSWHYVFYICGGVTLLIAVLWVIGMGRYEKMSGAPDGKTEKREEKKQAIEGEKPIGYLILRCGLLFSMVAIVLQGMLRDGVTTWVPTLLSNVFHIEAKTSILVTVLLPVFGMVVLKISSAINMRTVKNEIRFSTILFGIAAVMSLLTVFFLKLGTSGCTLLCAALLTSCMHGINLMLICELPKRFADHSRVSFISGTLNACTYVGSAIATYGFARLQDLIGWNSTVLCWCLICVLGLTMCVLSGRQIRKAK